VKIYHLATPKLIRVDLETESVKRCRFFLKTRKNFFFGAQFDEALNAVKYLRYANSGNKLTAKFWTKFSALETKKNLFQIYIDLAITGKSDL
jgi:hypothetical protein